jgi:hypothetical protein
VQTTLTTSYSLFHFGEEIIDIVLVLLLPELVVSKFACLLLGGESIILVVHRVEEAILHVCNKILVVIGNLTTWLRRSNTSDLHGEVVEHFFDSSLVVVFL